MRTRRASAVAVSLALLAGCAHSGTLPWVEGPAELREAAAAALREGDPEGAYDRLAEIRRRYPESPESSEALLPAAQLFRKLWYAYRFVEERDAWRAEQTRFMFRWLGSQARDGFPRAEAELLLVQMPWSYWREFEAYARTDPYFARWEIRAEEDNGRVESIRVSAPREGPRAGT